MDAYNALCRMQEVFEAESLPDKQIEHLGLASAVELDDASFSWDAPLPKPKDGKGNGKEGKRTKKEKKCEALTNATPTSTSGSVPGSSQISTSQEPEATEVFKVQRTNLTIPKGQVVAIVGQVGSGKSSFLQGLIGEMRRETGSVKFCGSVSYCPQNAWIQVHHLAPCGIMSCIAKRITERYHPRKHLFRSAVQFSQVLASHFRLMPGFGLESLPQWRSHGGR